MLLQSRDLFGLCGCVSAANAACCLWRWDLHCVNMTLLETTARSDIETRWKIQMSDRQLWSICTSPIAAEVTYRYCGNVPHTIRPTFPVRTNICSMTVVYPEHCTAGQGTGAKEVLLLLQYPTDGTFNVTGFGKKLGCCGCQDAISLYAVAVRKLRRLQSVCCVCVEVTTLSVCMLWLWWICDAYFLFCGYKRTLYWYLYFSWLICIHRYHS